MSLNSEQITALAQAEADAAVAQPVQSPRLWRSSTRLAAALVLLTAGWGLTGLMFWSRRWQTLQVVAAIVATPVFMMAVAVVVKGLRAAREALEVVDAHD